MPTNSTMTFSYDDAGPVKKIKIDWLSDSSAGTASGTTKKISGRLLKGVTDPGTAAPTASYDIVITDPEGLNVLGLSQDDLLDRHSSNTEQVDFHLLDYSGTAVSLSAYPVVADVLTISVSGAGNAKTGQIILYWE